MVKINPSKIGKPDPPSPLLDDVVYAQPLRNSFKTVPSCKVNLY
jgi:hypothetical protein